MSFYRFIVVVKRPSTLEPSLITALMEAGCQDAQVFADKRELKLQFQRKAECQLQAVASALQQIAAADRNLCVLRVQPD